MADQEEDQGITAYHGSPHEFEQFEWSPKTYGIGEGVQAYGHGLYFAESEPVAKGYRDQLRQDFAFVDGQKIPHPSEENPHTNLVYTLANHLYQMGWDTDQAIDFANKHAESLKADLESENQYKRGKAEHAQKWAKDIAPFKGKKVEWKQDPGHMYEVSINAHPDHFLDWDKPFVNQSPYVKDLLKTSGLMKEYTDNLSDFSTPMQTRNRMKRGENIHAFIEHKMGKDPEKASQYLADLGIKGIKYLDAGSRDKKRGTRNYVVFDDKLVNIKRRYARGGTIYREGLAGGGNPGDIAGGGYGDGNIGGGTPSGDGSGSPTTGGDQYGGDQYGGNDNYSGSDGRDNYTSYGDGGPDLSIGGPQGLTGAAAFGRPELGTDTYNLDNAPPMTVGAKLAASPNIGADLVKEAVNPDLGTANSPFASGAQSYDQTALDAINERMKTDQQVLRDAAVQRTIGDRPSTIGIPNAPTSTANMYNMVGGPLTEGSYADAQSIYNQRLYNSIFGPEKETGAQISVPNAGDLYGATNAPLAIQQTPVSAPSPTANQSLEEYMGTVPPADMQQMITKQLQKTNQFNVNVKDFLDATGSPLSYATTYGMALPKLAEKNINFQPGQKIDPATGLPATGIATFTGNMNAKLTPEQQAAKDEFDKQFGKTFTPITKTTYGVEERGPMMGGDLTGPSMTFDLFSQMAPQEQTEAQAPVVASDVMRGTMGITPPAPAEPRVGMPQLAQQPIQIPQSQTQAQTNPSVPSYSSSLQPQQTIRQNFEQAFADARASGAQTFYWTNPKTGVTSLYGTKIARKEGGRVPSFNEPDEWLVEKNESKKNAVKKANKRTPKPERSPIVGRALMLSSSKS